VSEEGVERRLTTILAADVVGYSRLMGEDEAGTLAVLKAHRKELIEPKAVQYGGRTVKLMGDGALMEFASVVDAVAFAVEVQVAMRERNAGVPEDRQITYRVGINVGDIIVEGEDIYGDGVNVASRLEGLAEPGGICVRRNVRNQVRDKLDIDFEDLGEVEVKNIVRPVRVFSVVLDEKAEALLTPVVEMPATAAPSRLPQIAAALAVSVLVIGGLVWWQPWAWDKEPAGIEKTSLPLSDKPSIAVLPFQNLSDNSEQEYFADGMTEDLITDLSKVSGLFVIARNSSFAYKGKSTDLRQVGRELGVQNILEGSVRRVGERIRINVQLIDTSTGGHKWAERYDGEFSDIFNLQDQVMQSVIRELAVRLTPSDELRQAERRTVDPEAHDAFLRGWAHYVRSSAADYAAAIPHLEEALRFDPAYGQAHAALASIYQIARIRGWQAHLGLTPDDTLERAVEHLESAKKYPSPLAHQVASSFLTRQGHHDQAILEADTAIELDTNDPAGYFAKARALVFAGRHDEAATFIDKAKRLNPYYPADYVFYTGVVEFGQERYEAAIVSLENAHKLARDNPGVLMFLIATYGYLARTDDANAMMKKFRNLASMRSMEWIFSATVRDVNVWHFKRPEDAERLRAGLRRAGLPEFEAEWDLARDNRLSGERIRSLLFDHKIRGHHPVSRIEFTIAWGESGGFTARGLWNDSGISQIEDYRLCNEWKKYRRSCAVVYQGAAEGNAAADVYTLVQRSGAYPFSIVSQ
jgi:TolB-like protein/Flp pilus assembly protein TadD